jgi:hypothetical protein
MTPVHAGASAGAPTLQQPTPPRSVVAIVLFVLGGLLVAAGLVAALASVDVDGRSDVHCSGPALVAWATNDEPCRSEAQSQFFGSLLFLGVGLILIVVAVVVRHRKRANARSVVAPVVPSPLQPPAPPSSELWFPGIHQPPSPNALIQKAPSWWRRRR